VFLLGCCFSSCASPTFPSADIGTPTNAASIIGGMAVAFLNRFATSTIPPEACLVDFTSACRGRAEELSDIEANRAHFEIFGARIGTPAVVVNPDGMKANISIPCAFDSQALKCDTADCTPGAFGTVAGTCTLTGVREPSGWKLCTSNFSGTVITPAFFSASMK
jgi:hypothetical protein